MNKQQDVIILGGGRSGLTLSLQLKQRFPDLDILKTSGSGLNTVRLSNFGIDEPF